MARKLWLPGAEKIEGPHFAGLPMAGGDGYYATHHITVSPPGSYTSMRGYLLKIASEPTLLIDAKLGKIGQYLPGNRGAYALENHVGGIETNRLGKIHLQVEWVWDEMSHDIREAKYFDECWERFVEFARQLGVPDKWPFGFSSTAKTASKQTVSGHRGHRNWVENNHSDSLPAARQPAWPSKAKPLAKDTADAAKLVTARMKARKAPVDDAGKALLRDLRSATGKALAL